MKSYIIPIAVVVFAVPAAFGLHAGEPPVAQAMDCMACHVSAHPTLEDMQLKPCPRPAEVQPAPASDEVADFLILDQLTDIYVPVVFPHKLHAAMGEMSEGCSICHHRNPEGPILKCSECHGGPSNPVNLKQPGLKGAYHRQCLGCHREWTHETDCVVCHAKREPGKPDMLPLDPTDIMGRLHPKIEVPDVKVYESDDEMMSEARFVTFHHKQHVDLFGFKCVDCHKQESCSSCHDIGHKQPHVRLEPHDDCMQCHQPQIESDCTHCHDSQVREKGFDHLALTEFDTGLYHKDVACNECHTGSPQAGFSGLKADCAACHDADFQPAEFDHATTGVPLGFLHSDASCSDCHVGGIGGPVSCANCHDEERTPSTVEEIP